MNSTSHNLRLDMGLRAESMEYEPLLAPARHQRREKNLKLRQPTLPLDATQTVANRKSELSH